MFFLIMCLCLLLPLRLLAQTVVADEKPQQVIVSVQDQTVITPAFQGVPFCTGTVHVDNQTKHPLKFLEINLMYRDEKGHTVSLKKRFNNVPVNQGRQQSLAFSGYICKNIFTLPVMEQKTCLWDKDTENDCRSTVVLKALSPVKEAK